VYFLNCAFADIPTISSSEKRISFVFIQSKF
jgi:hypothetical protein